MENGHNIEELISKYLADETDTAEDLIVLKWIKASETNREQFEKMRNVWLLSSFKAEIDKIDTEHEWTVFEEILNSGESLKKLPDINESCEILPDEKRIRRVPFYKLIVAAAIAASIIMILWPGHIFKADMTQNKELVINKKISEEPGKGSTVHNEKNFSEKIKEIALEDGSRVFLYDKSEIDYNEPFTNLREVVISGKAKFEVAKDPTKPFTVFSNDISTTALGTNFSVENFEGSKNIIIKLYEGKVLIKSVDTAKRKLGRNYYLLAGEELVYNKRNATAFVKKIRINNSFKPNDTSYAKEVPWFPRNHKGSWYMFNNESLANVFNQLQDIYNVKIEYSENDIRNMYFIGKFDKSLSVDSVLKEITTLNDLELIKDNNSYRILTKE